METINQPYNKIIIYYFSGTGNARYAAKTIAGTATLKNLDVVVINIADRKEVPPVTKDKNYLIGFCFPTHGFNAPPIMLKFISRFPKGRADVFVLNTRAGLKLHKLHLPGLGGAALWLPALMLWMKGYKPVGFRPIDLPSNWISLHPGVRKKVKDSIVANCTKTLQKFTHKILTRRPALNGLLWLPIDIAVLPIAFAYYFLGRFALSKTFFASYKCNNCGLCIKQCPVNAIKEINNRPYWLYTCESCMKCMNHCPQRAIETAQGFTFFLWWFVFSILPMLGLKLLSEYGILSKIFIHKYNDLLSDLLILIVGLPVVFGTYKLLHYALRFQFFNKLITWTSFTHFRFWRRYRLEDSETM
jgi:ferredoxin